MGKMTRSFFCNILPRSPCYACNGITSRCLYRFLVVRVGPIPNALENENGLLAKYMVSFMKSKLFAPIDGPRGREIKKKKKYFSFMVKFLLLGGTQIGEGEVMMVVFLIRPPKMIERQLLVGTLVLLGPQINGNVIS